LLPEQSEAARLGNAPYDEHYSAYNEKNVNVGRVPSRGGLINIRIYLDCHADQGPARNDRGDMDLPFEIRI